MGRPIRGNDQVVFNLELVHITTRYMLMVKLSILSPKF
jgi:hypothetical protein